MGLLGRLGLASKRGPNTTGTDIVEENPFSLKPTELESLNEVCVLVTCACYGLTKAAVHCQPKCLLPCLSYM